MVGAAVGLAGTSRVAAWLGSVSGATGRPPPVLAWSTGTLGELMVSLSLLGVLPFLGGGPRAASRVARLLGVSLVLLFLPLLLWTAGFELGWFRFGGQTPYGGPPPLLVGFLVLAMCLPSVAVVPFALAAFLRRRAGLGAVLLGLCGLAVPHLLVRQFVSGGNLGEIPQSGAVVLLGGLGAGVGLLEASLWALFGTVLLRGAQQRARGEEFRAREKANARAARRLYAEGLGAGDASAVDELVSEDFRDLKSGARGSLGMERVFAALRRSYPDLSVSVESQEAEGDLVRTRLLLVGTDEGGVLWYPPTGRRVGFSAVFSDCFEGGLLVEHSGEADTGELLRQLGHPTGRDGASRSPGR